MIIAADPFLDSSDYTRFLRFREMRSVIKNHLAISHITPLPGSFFNEFRKTNPEFYEVYSLIGDYYYKAGHWKEAETEYRIALSKTIPRWNEKKAIIGKLADCNIRLK